MIILQAIKHVLIQENHGLTCREITKKILDQGLYNFNTPNPNTIVNHMIRRHCYGLDFASAHPVKHFTIISGERGNTVYDLLERATPKTPPEDSHSGGEESELLPEEKMEACYAIHKAQIKEQLLDSILNNDPAFFEHLVVELLIALGYGYGTESGMVVGRSHDGGIDGIINEDKLGLDKIYIQAKRYAASQKIGRKEVQAFVGAMASNKKGVFITTSDFAKTARDYVKGLGEKSISLIDGDMLTELMVRSGVGVRRVKSYDTYEIDVDYFGAE